jgi:hypothetical protein
MYAGIKKCCWKFKKHSIGREILDGLPSELATRRFPRGLIFSLHEADVIKSVGYSASGSRVWDYGESYHIFVRILEQIL